MKRASASPTVATQKGLSCPPELAPFTASVRAIERLQARKQPNHTPPVSAFYVLREGPAAIAEEGLERRWERHRRCHAQFVKG